MTTLLIDAGNTRVKWAVLADGSIRRPGHVAQQKLRDLGWQALTTKLPRRVERVFISNVAGANFANRISSVIGTHCNCSVQFAHSERRGWGVTNAYRQPRRLGVDRWVALVAAWTEFETACLIVDAGTAVTLDAIDGSGNHIGGQILPGAETMLSALSSATSDLPHVKSPRRASEGLGFFARNTSDALREGAMNAVVGAVGRARETMQSSGLAPTVILTGGGASRILAALSGESKHRPDIVLEGLACMLDREK